MTMPPDATIAILVEPPRNPLPPLPGVTYTSPRVSCRYDAFAEALGKHTRARVRVAEGFLRDTPADLVLLHHDIEFTHAVRECAAAGDLRVAKRVFLLNVGNVAITEELDGLGVAGAIAVTRFLKWLSGNDERVRAELYGLRALPPPPSRRTVKELFDIERYATYEGEPQEGLPSLLARYLEAYWVFLARQDA